MNHVSNEVIKIVQALGVILDGDSNHKMNRVKLIKLLWVADRYHIRKYGRTLTETNYVAMEHGPVNSLALDIARMVSDGQLSESDVEFVSTYFTPNGAYTAMNLKPDTNYLSETDQEALEFALCNFKDFDEFDLADNFSHKFPEWKRYEAYYAGGNKSSRPIDEYDFFKNPPQTEDDPFALSDEDISASKYIYEENSKFKESLIRTDN